MIQTPAKYLYFEGVLKSMFQTECSQSRKSGHTTYLGVLIGLLLTDGSVRKTKHSNKVIFSNKSEELHKLFRDIMQKLFQIKKFEEYTDARGVKSTTVNKKEIVDYLLTLTPSYRTKPYEDGNFSAAKIPGFIEKMRKKDLALVLQAMFSGDGSVVLGIKWHKLKNSWVFTRRIQLTSEHPVILDQLANILRKNFDTTPKIWRNQVVLDNKKDIQRFQKEIGFVKGLKTSMKSRNWFGKEKNAVLKLLIKSFEIKKRDLDQFKTKEDAIMFLKNFDSVP
jgi:hypothetical protein